MDEYLQNYMFFKFSGRSSHKSNKEKYPEPLKNTLLKTEQWEFFFTIVSDCKCICVIYLVI